MGPMAGVECYRYVLENTKSNGTDQDNLDALVVSYPQHIENRVNYIVGTEESNPGESVLRFIKPYLQMLSATHKHIVIGIPCVTFHCPAIFSVFSEGLRNCFPNAKIISIISSTVDYIQNHYPTITQIGLLSTEGTRRSKPFQHELAGLGKSIIYLSDSQQQVVSECIFNTQW